MLVERLTNTITAWMMHCLVVLQSVAYQHPCTLVLTAAGADALAFAIAQQLQLRPRLKYVFKEDPRADPRRYLGACATTWCLQAAVKCIAHGGSCRLLGFSARG